MNRFYSRNIYANRSSPTVKGCLYSGIWSDFPRPRRIIARFHRRLKHLECYKIRICHLTEEPGMYAKSRLDALFLARRASYMQRPGFVVIVYYRLWYAAKSQNRKFEDFPKYYQ